MKEQTAFARVADGVVLRESTRRTILLARCALTVIGFASATAIRAQSQAPKPAPPAFEVASIKPSEDMMAVVRAGKMPHVGMKVDVQRVDIGYFTMAQLISYAYKVKPYQISGPEWMKSAHWDIAATLPEGATKEQIPEMMQALLADRFKLAIHHDQKEMPVLAMEVGKNGVKMAPSPPDTPVPDAAANEKGTTTIDTGDGKVQVKTTGKMGEGGSTQISGGPAGNVKMSVTNGVMHMESSKVTMEMLSQQLTGLLGEPVIDQTGLKGNYVVAIDLSMEDIQAIARSQGLGLPASGPDAGSANATAVPTASDPSGGSVYSSVEKLGLKLNKQKLPVVMIVVDHLEKTPTEN